MDGVASETIPVRQKQHANKIPEPSLTGPLESALAGRLTGATWLIPCWHGQLRFAVPAGVRDGSFLI